MRFVIDPKDPRNVIDQERRRFAGFIEPSSAQRACNLLNVGKVDDAIYRWLPRIFRRSDS